MTLDLSPGPWRHGLAPALRVALRTLPAEGDAAAVGASPALEKASGISATRLQEGSSVPLAPRYYRDREVDVQAVVVSRAPLVYPELAYVSRLAGSVRARVYIGEDGAVDAAQIVDAWPRRGVFDEAALKALRQLRYKPAEIAGQAVKSQKLVDVKFDPYQDRGG